MRYTILASIGLVALAATLPAQNCVLLKDINTTGNPNDSFGSAARQGPGNKRVEEMVKIGTTWYFTARTNATGTELWKTDGTASGTMMVKDIYPGTSSSGPFYLIACNGKLYFRAFEPTNGTELWCSDGTESGTVLVKDIRTGTSSSSPSYLMCMGTKFYFSASDGTSTGQFGNELWESDGTASGTVLLKDIRTGTSSSSPRYMKLNSAGTAFYFAAADATNGTELWSSDGTATGTALVADIRTGSLSSSPLYLTNLGGKTIFRATGANGTELFSTDGTATGTVEVLDIRTGTSSSSPNMFYNAVLGGSFFFTASDGTSSGQSGTELWKTDGTATGTVMVKDIRAGTSSSFPNSLYSDGTRVYLYANDGTNGYELWTSDGTATGTTLIKDIYPGAGSSSPRNYFKLGTKVAFDAFDGTATTGTGRELYTTDGTATGTAIVKDIATGTSSSSPSWLTSLSASKIMFFADDVTDKGRELWESDGTASGTKLLADINPGTLTNSSSPSSLHCENGKVLYFSAFTSAEGRELYKTDSGGTDIVSDIGAGTLSSSPSFFTTCWTGTKSITVFRAFDATTGTELYITDGTASGTALLKDIRTGTSSSFPSNLTCCGNKIFFSASDGTSSGQFGTELWCTDGTASGTVMVKDIRTGTGSSSPSNFVCCKGVLYLRASSATGGIELWKSDGTASGTVQVADIRAGTLSSSPSNLVCCGDKVYFSANDGTNGTELWVSDGSATGTMMVANLQTGSSSSSPSSITCCGDMVAFRAFTSASGTELFISDGTASGTTLLSDTRPGTSSGFPSNLTKANGKLFFSTNNGTNGTELWCSDLTPTGTALVKDAYTGTGSSSPSQLTAAGRGVFYRAFVSSSVGGNGTELWFSDGTSSGTAEYCDLWPGASSSSPSNLTVCCGTLYFTANDGTTGTEVYRVSGFPGTIESVGSGCGVNHAILSATDPVIGKPMTLSGSCAPAASGLLLVGLPDNPISLAPILLPECCLFVNPFVFDLVPQPAGTDWSVSFTVPNNHFFIGLKFGLQSVYGDELSNGLFATVGGK